jgi:hypothetical protein
MKSLNCARLVTLVLASCLGVHSAPPGTSQDDSVIRSVLGILGSLQSYDRAGRPASQRISFELPEPIINSYLSYSLKVNPRPGLQALKVHFPANNLIAVDATLNLDRLLASDSVSVPETSRPQLKGNRTVRAEFRIRVDAGRLTFEFQSLSTEAGGLPPTLLKELIRVGAAMQPEHLDTTAPIPLPFGLKRLSVGPQGLAGDTW